MKMEKDTPCTLSARETQYVIQCQTTLTSRQEASLHIKESCYNHKIVNTPKHNNSNMNILNNHILQYTK